MHYFKCNSAQHFAHDCTGSRNNINTVIESDQAHFTLFNVNTCYQNIINDSNGQKCISTKWFITKKFNEKRKIMKTHLVVHGYEGDLHNLKIDSPACSCEAMCIVMLTVSVMKWWVKSLYFTLAFL